MNARFDRIGLHRVERVTTQERFWADDKRWTRTITIVFADGSETAISLFKDGDRSIPLETLCTEEG